MSSLYTLSAVDGGLWKIHPQAFSINIATLSDRRQARRAVRMARKLGYTVRFVRVTR